MSDEVYQRIPCFQLLTVTMTTNYTGTEHLDSREQNTWASEHLTLREARTLHGDLTLLAGQKISRNKQAIKI